MQLQIIKLTSQPSTWLANSLYFVKNGNYTETYFTDTAGNPKMVGNSSMINALIDAKFASTSAGILKIYATISARNTDKANLTYNQLVLVTDATGDTTVGSGAALYVYNRTTDAFTKIAEYENMDVQLQWANVSGRPTSSVAQIDAAVGAMHSHNNKAELDLYGSDGNGNATYNGQPILQTLITNW